MNPKAGFSIHQKLPLTSNPEPLSGPFEPELHEPCHYDDSLIFVGYALISVGLALAGIAVGFLLLGWLA